MWVIVISHAISDVRICILCGINITLSCNIYSIEKIFTIHIHIWQGTTKKLYLFVFLSSGESCLWRVSKQCSVEDVGTRTSSMNAK